jgi:outer membrane protein
MLLRLLHRFCFSFTLASALVCTAPAHSQGLDGLDALESVQSILGNAQSSPLPNGWTVGAVGYSGPSVYADGSTSTMLIPGGIYLGSEAMFLGDRAFYTFARDGNLSYFGRARVRLGNLSPQDSPQWTGLEPRPAQLEGGLGSVLISPVGLWSARLSTDISNRSNGSEALLNWSAPLIGERWLAMGSVGLMWRSSSLANYYFGGVSASEATPQRPAYDVGATWSPVISLVTSYRLSPQWLVGGVLSYEAFADSVRESPLVQKNGRYDALLGIGYVWK